MIDRATMIGIFTGVGTSTGMMLATKAKKKEHHYVLYGIAGGVAGTILGRILCAFTHPKTVYSDQLPVTRPEAGSHPVAGNH
jgi:hypothetical protein